jgi:CRISPR/Cas system-associated exonuclease Cas4 (RecB family)
MLDLKAAAKAYLEGAKKPFSHNRQLTIGASEIGACARRVWYEKKLGKSGYDPGFKESLGAAQRGDILEDHFTTEVVKHAVKAQLGGNAELIWSGREGQKTLISPTWFMSATPDGMIINAPLNALEHEGISTILSHELVVEMKSFDPRILSESLPKQQHVDQLIMQMGLIRKEGTYAPAFGIIVYVNASFLDDVRVFPVAYNHDTFTNQIRRALYIMNAKEADQVRPEGKVAGEKECQHCPFAQRCIGYAKRVGKRTADIEAVPKEDAKVIKHYVEAINDFTDRAKHLEQTAEEYKAGLKEALSAHKLRALDGHLKDGTAFEIRWSTTTPRGTWKSDKLEEFLKAHGQDPEDFRNVGKIGERLSIKLFQKPKSEQIEPVSNQNEQQSPGSTEPVA